MPLKLSALQRVVAVATSGPQDHGIFLALVGKWFQRDAIGPIQGTVTLGLDNGLLGRPGYDMSHEVIGINKLFLTGIKELVTHSQHLVAILLLGINSDHRIVADGHRDQSGRVCNAHVHLDILDQRSPMDIVSTSHRLAHGMAQEQSLGRTLALPLERQSGQVLTRDIPFTTQRQQAVHIFIKTPHQHPSASLICQFIEEQYRREFSR